MSEPPHSYEEFFCLFQKAENMLKQIELLTNELSFPPVNELRYAGKHISKALVASDTSAASDEISSAEKHCKRSLFDSMEIGIAYFLRRFAFFAEDYRRVEISGVVSDYVKYLETIRQAQSFLANNSIHDSFENWKIAEEHFVHLKEIDSVLQTARVELDKRLRHRRFAVITTLIGLFLGVLAIVVKIILATLQR